MEKSTPPQDPTSESEKLNINEPAEISSPASGQTNNQNLIVILLVLILMVVVGISAYYFGVQKGIQPLSPQPAMIDQQNPANKMGDSENNLNPAISVDDSQSESLTPYQDQFAAGLQFNYDSTIWTSQTQTTDRETILTLTHQPSNDVLTFKYTLAWGMGGGHHAFKNSELVQVDAAKKLYRLQSTSQGKTTYRYGLDKAGQNGQTSTVVFFDTNPQAKQQEIEYCQKLKSGEEVYTIYSDEICNDIIAGKYQGFVQEPAFDWSFSMKTKVPLSQINPSWAADEYVQAEGLDNGTVLVIITFSGTHVEAADEIVKQIQI